jgi:hypothetical protein
MYPQTRNPRTRHWRSGIAFAGLLAVPLAIGGSTVALGNLADISPDAIVGTWVGQAAQPNQDPFEVRLTFVSPRGGVSRYPNDPVCGGILTGDREGDHYEYQERITFGSNDDVDNGCLNGTLHLTVSGDKMKFDWSATSDGQDLTSSGELRRQGGPRKR